MNIPEMIEVLQAAKDGKEIQIWSPTLQEWVVPFEDKPNWNFAQCDYRVKPELREWWINIYPGCGIGVLHDTQADADAYSKPERLECIHIREVLD